MAVKVYTPGQFYAAGGVVEEMFYQEVGRTKNPGLRPLIN